MNATTRPTTKTDVGSPLVMVGVDGSDASVEALRWAFAEAERIGGQVEAVYVYATPSETGWYVGGHPGVLPPDRKLVIESAERELARAIRRAVGDDGPARISTVVVPDVSTSDALNRLSRRADMLVVGAHRSWGLGRLFGSTTSAVLRAATCPVVVIPPDDPAERQPDGEQLVPAATT